MNPGFEPQLESDEDFAAQRTKARRRTLIVGAALVVALGGGGWFVSHRAARAAEQERAAAVEAVRGCLLEQPLEPGESVARRFRRLQLVALARPDAQHGQGDWPRSCKARVSVLIDRLGKNFDAGELDKLARLNQFLSDDKAVFADATAVLEPVFGFLDERFPGPVPSGATELPEVPLDLDALAQLPPLSAHGTALSHTYTEDNPGLALPVIVDDDSMSAPLWCVFLAQSKRAECRNLDELKAVQGHGLRLLGTSDDSAATLVFAGKRGSEGVFAVGSAQPVTRLFSYGGYAAADGGVSVLGWDEAERQLVLVQKSAGADAVRTVLRPNFRVGNYFYGSQLLWDQVLVRGVTPDQHRKLFLLPTSKANASSFELVDIGDLEEPGLIRHGEEDKPHLTGCRTSAMTVVRVRGYDSDFLTFRVGSSFSQPVNSPTWGTLGCHRSTATQVKAGFAPTGTRLYHASCTSAGCNVRDFKPDAIDGASLEMRPTDARYVQAVDLDGKLLVVWLAGERGGLRMRIGEPDLFERAPARVLFDDHVERGKDTSLSTLLGFRLYSREHFAVLLLSSMAGLHALRIDPDGSVSPFELKGG